MSGNLPLCIIRFPSGRYGYVGTVPAILGSEAKASTSDVMGGRSYKNKAGELVAIKFPTFETALDAYDFAAIKGYSAITPELGE